MTELVGRGRGRGRGVRGGRSGESASSSRGIGRGSGRGRGQSKNKGKSPQRLEQPSKERIEEMWEKRKEEMKGIVVRVDEAKLRECVLDIIEREQYLSFDLCESAVDGNSGNDRDTPAPNTETYPVPSWCKCVSCRAMLTYLENKCSSCLRRNCISARPQMDRIVLDLEELAIGNRYYKDMLGRHRQRIEDNNKSKRHAAYRNFAFGDMEDLMREFDVKFRTVAFGAYERYTLAPPDSIPAFCYHAMHDMIC